MVLINGNIEIKVYNLDTLQTFLNRVSSNLQTIPKYLYFPNGIPKIEDLQTMENIEVIDLLDILKRARLDFLALYKYIENKYQQQNLSLYLDIFLPFLVFNKTLSNTSKETLSSFLLVLSEKIGERSLIDKSKLENLESIYFQNKSQIKESIEQRIEANVVQANKDLLLVTQLERVSVGVEHTNFELEKVNIDMELDIKNMSIIEIFNSITLDEYVPFATVNNYFKILKDFLPIEDWDVSLENIINFKVLQKPTLLDAKHMDYMDIYLSFSDDLENKKVNISLALNIGKQYLNDLDELIIKRFFKCLNKLGNISVLNTIESSVNGVFYFPKYTVNKYILSDLIMNNPIFSSFMSVDESDKATKKKDSLYIHFYNEELGEIAFNVTDKIAIRNDANLKNKDISETFKIGEKYTRVKISYADSYEAVEKFQSLLSKLFVIYTENYKDIENFYKQFIPDLFDTQEVAVIEDKKMKLKDIAPEIFVTGFPSKCPYKPTIISDDEVLAAQNEGKIVMTYPKPGEGFISRNYICEHTKAKYPGLRENPLKNKDVVPYLPCCYVKNHTTSPGSLYRHYFFDEEIKEKIPQQQDIIKTNKFVEKDKFGMLIGDIRKLFEIFSDSNQHLSLRKGVSNTKSSFLECVLEAVGDDILDIEENDDREQYLTDIREEIGSDTQLCATAKQEMYDYTMEQIQEYITDSEQYLDPRYVISLLENRYNCNIYVFNRYGFKSGTMVKPRYLQNYYRFTTDSERKNIFIYEHLGSTSDHAKYPRCELIVKWTVGTENQISPDYDSEEVIVQKVREIYNNLLKSYSLNVENTQAFFPLKLTNEMSQSFDSFGKTRMITVNHNSTQFSLLLKGIPSLKLQESNNIIPIVADYENAIEFCKSYNIAITGRTKQELLCVLGNISITIPITNGQEETDSIPMISIEEQQFPKNKNSALSNYNKYKKLSRYILEYVYWLFSKYIVDFDGNIEEQIVPFVDSNIVIIPDFEYKDVTKTFSYDSSLMKDNKLVVKSKETLKRLIYSLRLAIRNNRNKIKSYHTFTSLENFYLELSDFDQYPYQVIIYGENSVNKWLANQKCVHRLNYSIQLTSIQPYFFKNQNIDDNIYLLQNTNDLNKAKQIVVSWVTNGYNLSIDAEENMDSLEFTFYNFISQNKIDKYLVKGQKNNYDMKILGYKLEDVSYFSAMLRL